MSLTKSRNQRDQRDTALTMFSQTLAPSKTSLAAPRSISDQLFRELQSNSKFKIDRTMVMGSVGKKTALAIDYDYDCVIFINKIKPEDFDEVKEDFKDVLIRSNLEVEDTNNTPAPLKVTIEGMEFDLVPAINFRDENWYEEQQWERTLDHIKALPNPSRDGYKYSSCLEERQIKFIKQQSAFTHDLIRLAKYWNKTVFVSDYLSGRSSLIECIAVYAANKEENKKENKKDISILRAFRSFLELVIEFCKLDIVFEKFYERSDIDESIAKQRPLVMDPSNPYNNMAYGLVQSPDIMAKFQDFAKTTLQRLDLYYSEYSIGIAEIFRTQPVPAPEELMSRYFAETNRWLVEVEGRFVLGRPKVILRNKRKLQQKGKNIIQTYLCNNIKLLQRRGMFTKDELKINVTDIINNQIYGKGTHVEDDTSQKKHTEYDVTYEIPCGLQLIQVSFILPDK